MTNCLILVDFQEEWRDKNSEYYLGDFTEKIRNAVFVLEEFRKRKEIIVFTRHVELNSNYSFKEGTKNAELLPELNVKEDEKVITKHKISPFYQTDLEDFLKSKNVTHLYVGGIMTNLCVRSLISDAYDRDYEITVIKDCCVSDSEETDEFTFKDIKKTRPEVNIVTSKEVVELLKKSD